MRKDPRQLSIPSNKSKAPGQEYKPFVPGPNPELPGFIRQHSTSYDEKTDRYDVPAFNRDIIVDKAHPPKAIYDMHTYWSKKHWAAIREYIRHYYYCVTNVIPSSGFSHTAQTRNQEGGGHFVTQ
jgi:hypothetical protein